MNGTNQLLKQASTVLATAGIAAGLTFIQSLIAQGGFCPDPIFEVERSAVLGGALRTAHIAISVITKSS